MIGFLFILYTVTIACIIEVVLFYTLAFESRKQIFILGIHKDPRPPAAVTPQAALILTPSPF